VSAYLTTEQEANEFVKEATTLKMRQKVNFDKLEEADRLGIREDHPVIPSKREISALAI